MFKTLKAKCIAGLLSLAVIGGGITAVVLVNSNNDKEVVQDEGRDKNKQDDKDTKDKDKTPDNTKDHENEETKGDKQGEKEDGKGGQEITNTPADSEEKDYTTMAAQIEAGAVAYFEAMKAGDIETILSMTDPENGIYDKLSGIKDFETGKEFIRTVYANLCYGEIEEGSTEYRLKDALERGRDEFFLKMYAALPETLLFNTMLEVPGVLFQDGEFIPDGYEVKSAEEALQIVRTVMERIPLTDCPVTVEFQEDGTFYFDIVGAFSIIDTINFARYGFKESFLEEFLSKQIPGGVVIGTSDVAFAEGCREEWNQILSLLKQKDFAGLCELANSDTSKYTRGTAYKRREELTGEQRAFLDSYIEQLELCISDTTWSNSKKRSTTVVVISPALSLDKDEMAWYTEHGVKESNIAWRIGGDGIGDLKSAMGDLMICWKDAINYAEWRIK